MPAPGTPAEPGTVPAASCAIVTGGTGGIGLAVTRVLAERGHRLFLCSRGAEAIRTAAGRLRADGLEVDGAACDVRDPRAVGACVRAAVDRFGPVGVLVNIAARTAGGPTAELSDDLWFDVINTNLTGVFLMSREVLTTGRMREGGGGRIVNVAPSAGGRGTAPGGSPYSASRHGVVGFTRALGDELARSGITVNAVCPGYVGTPHPVAAGTAWPPGPAGGPGAAVPRAEDDDGLGRFRASFPSGRYATPEEVAGMVAYLCSDLAASITGQVINVSGGDGGW